MDEMTPPKSRRPLLTLAVCAGLVLVAAAGVYAASAAQAPSYAKRGTLHCIEERGYLYSFDAVWRIEALRRIDPSTHVTAPVADPDRLARLRSSLLKQLKVPALEGIPVEGKSELEAVRALGYL